jgi:lipopolysaccharide export system permease protein
MDFRIKKLDIFIVRQFGLLFVGTFFICQFVLMMQFLWRYIDELIGKGLSMEVLAQFFWYMALMLVPQALPLAILLSSLIAFGNLGESSELTAIKAAGISLMQSFRSLIFLTSVICVVSFIFQNNIGPKSNMKLTQLLISMKQKSPELEIPEGVFYDGIPNTNLYVQKKDVKTGKLYGIMIYRMTQSYEDAAIILADSGMLQSTAEKKHLLLSLWSGEWFENMQSQQLAGSAAVPYRRESFIAKQIVLDFDGDFNMTDASSLSSNAKAKSLTQLMEGIDSLNHTYDSIGRAFYNDAKRNYYAVAPMSRKDSLAAARRAGNKDYDVAAMFGKLKPDQQRQVMGDALSLVQSETSDLDFKSMLTGDNERILRQHKIEAINKFTLALQCLIFFFIGAPLGAIIRKGGLGLPVIISVLVFIIYYILDNSGYRMARLGVWAIWFGKGLAPAVMIPVAAFVTYKAQNDSVVFNADAWRRLISHALGLRTKRHVASKEVIIAEPDYNRDNATLLDINRAVTEYSHGHNLVSPPNVIKVFFRYQEDHEIERISKKLEETIEDLSNTRDKQVMYLINQYPVLAVKAHTRPFDRRWANTLAAVIFPLGMFFYFRMWRFRLRLLRDLRVIRQTSSNIISYTERRLGSGNNGTGTQRINSEPEAGTPCYTGAGAGLV